MRNLFVDSQNVHNIFLHCLFYVKTKKVLGIDYLSSRAWCVIIVIFLVCINVLPLFLNQKWDTIKRKFKRSQKNPSLGKKKTKQKKTVKTEGNEITRFYLLKGDKLDKEFCLAECYLWGRMLSVFKTVNFMPVSYFTIPLYCTACRSQLKQCDLYKHINQRV